MQYTTIVHKNGEISGVPLRPVEKKSKEGEVSIEDNLKKGDTIFFELTGNVVEKTGQGFKVTNRKIKEGVVREGNTFHDVTVFQPTIGHNGNKPLEPRPTYETGWEHYSGTGKTKKLLYVEFSEHYKNYWQEQRRRCKEGYTVGGVKITGFHYFYLNFWPIWSKKQGEGYIFPRFLDIDFDFYNKFQECLIEGLNLLLLKRRQLGFSEKSAALAAYYMLILAPARSLIISGDARYSTDTFLKAANGIKNLDRRSEAKAAEAFASRLLVDKVSEKPEIKLGYEVDGLEVGLLSQLWAISTNKSLASMAGKNADFALLEEFGMMNHSNLVVEYLKPVMEEGGIMSEGKIILGGGTGGEIAEGGVYFQRQFFNPTSYGWKGFKNEDGRVTGLFYGAQWYYVTDNSGNSYHYESETIVKELRKGMDSASLLVFTTQMPLKPEDAFLSKEDTIFYNPVLAAHTEILIANRKEIEVEYARYDWIKDNEGNIVGVEQSFGAKTTPDADGDEKYPFEITERCRFKKGIDIGKVFLIQSIFENNGMIDGEDNLDCVHYKNLYYGGTDSYDQDKSTTDSKGAFAIYKGELRTDDTKHHIPIHLKWRPKKKEKFYEQTLMASIYWGAKNMIEHTKILIINHYIYEGFTKVLAKKPQLLYLNKVSESTNVYGTDASTKPLWESHTLDWINAYPTALQHPDIANTLLRYESNKNSDLGIAVMLARVNYLNSNTKKAKKASATDENTANSTVMLGYVRSGGKMVNVNSN